MYSAYPTGFDLIALYAECGVTLPGTFNPAQKIAAAIQEWEKRTNWRPFLAGASTARRFTPPGPRQRSGNFGGITGGGRRLDLDGGILSVDSLTVNGQNYTEGIQFWMQPANAPAKGEPYQEIEFFTAIMGLPQSIVVTGPWGYSVTVPEDAWLAILHKAAYNCKPQVEMLITNGLAKCDDVTYASGGFTPLSAQAQQWLLTFEEALGEYTRSVF